ncbi:MAG TPA: hypothetical protein VFE82_18245 [Ramlibacter sp.]|jgi:hypothetical protein|uniref:hypothetical protein n=1 Tax=Ramlibacter sp. TaxID=1917967 RepID=UPI002D578751|nr:hypothetical protein [Ramlibacter sp.]HZY20417.1 hypothetical protein [Ramlibacter sp.]
MTAFPTSLSLRVLGGLLACTITAVPALAEKPEWAGGGKGHGKKHEDGGKHEAKGGRHEVRVGAYFSDHDREAARASYGQRDGSGKGCPPGLAKKNNGCMPPGQAKKYALGRPLPPEVVIYPVPRQVLVTLPPAPAGHKYVRVAADVLLIAVGSSMVIDAIADLGRL